MTRTYPVEGECPEDKPLTGCRYWVVSKSNPFNIISMKFMPIVETPLCGECSPPVPEIIQTWRENNPFPIPYSNMLNVPGIRDYLYTQLQNRSTFILSETLYDDGWLPVIEYNEPAAYLQTGTVTNPLLKIQEPNYIDHYLIARHGSTWKNLLTSGCSTAYPPAAYHKLDHLKNSGSLTLERSISCRNDQICICDTCLYDTCPCNCVMPWWQSPAEKFPGLSKNKCNCLLPNFPGKEYGCSILYENTEANWTPGIFKPIPIEEYAPAKEFIKVFNKFVADNWNNEHFQSNFILPEEDWYIPFWGKITQEEGSSSAKVTLELWKLNKTSKVLERVPEAETQDQSDVYRNWIMLFPLTGGGGTPPRTCEKNYILTFDTASCTFQEFIIPKSDYPVYTTSDRITVHFIECYDVLLSQNNPDLFQKVKNDFFAKSEFPTCESSYGTCCYLTADKYGQYQTDCRLTLPESCNVDVMQSFVNAETIVLDDPYLRSGPIWAPDIPKVVSVSFDSNSSSCENKNCRDQFDVAIGDPSKRLGTCCYLKEDGTWGCAVNVKEQCEFLEGFFTISTPDGIGGFNPPSCETEGIVAIDLDGSSSTIVLGPRNCTKYPKIPVNPNPDDPNTMGSCVSLVDSKQSVVELSTLTVKTRIECGGYTFKGSTKLPSFISFAMINDGSIVKLTFSDNAILSDLYDINSLINGDLESSAAQSAIARIESDFSVKNNGGSTNWKAKFKKIENNSIFLSVITE